MDFKIIVHALKMIAGNLFEALKISLFPAFCAVAVAIMIGAFLSQTYLDLLVHPGTLIPTDHLVLADFWKATIIGSVAIGFTSLWIIVNRHRFILLEEYPNSWFPKIRGGRMLAYFGYGLLLVFFWRS